MSHQPYDTLNLSGAVGDEADLVRENRARVEARFGMPVTWLRAVHGNDVHVVEEPGTPDPHLDALVTARRGTALAALAADCVPVLLTARDEVGAIRAVGAVHSGRRGVASGVVPAALDALRRTAGSDGPVTATIGPAICGRCYEVPAPMREEVAALVPQAWSTTSWGTPALDLPHAVAAQAAAWGARVRQTGLCTREDPRFYSHRGDGRSGRFCCVIGML